MAWDDIATGRRIVSGAEALVRKGAEFVASRWTPDQFRDWATRPENQELAIALETAGHVVAGELTTYGEHCIEDRGKSTPLGVALAVLGKAGDFGVAEPFREKPPGLAQAQRQAAGAPQGRQPAGVPVGWVVSYLEGRWP